MKTKIKEYRERFDMSQEQLSKLSGISRSIISDLENGKSENITLGTMRKISSAFGEEVSNIFLF